MELGEGRRGLDGVDDPGLRRGIVSGDPKSTETPSPQGQGFEAFCRDFSVHERKFTVTVNRTLLPSS